VSEASSPAEQHNGRLPPQALDAERYLLGSTLQDDSVLTDCFGILASTDFYLEKHACIFEAMELMYSKDNIHVDPVTLAEKLLQMGKLELVGGIDYLWQLAESVLGAGNVEQYAKIIKSKSLLRGLITSSNKIISHALDPTQAPEYVLELAEKEIFRLAESRVKTSIRPIRDILHETMAMIDKYRGDALTGVPTGFTELDNLTSGLQPTDLIVLAGRPGMGKTAFALSLLANAAIHHNRAVAFFSLEMGAEQLVQRILCSQARINMQLLRQGRLPKSDYPKISFVAGPISDAPIYIDDQPGLNLIDLKTKCRILKQKNALDMVIIDYLQLMQGTGGKENRQQEISQISRGLKELAKELKIPVMALSQLSRKVEERGGDGKPMLSDLRESGAIEQDADMVWFVFRSSQYDKEAPHTDAELIVAKHRNGPTENIQMTFLAEHAAFYDYSGRTDDYEFGGGM
jgi:replicative DNA helicase